MECSPSIHFPITLRELYTYKVIGKNKKVSEIGVVK